jgi:hypothetical protein
MIKLTEKQLIKILTEILPNGWDKKSVQVRTCPYSNSESVKEISATDEVLGRKVWFYYYQDDNKNWVLDMDGANSWDYLSHDSEYFWSLGQELEVKFVKFFTDLGLYPHPQNHYSYVVGEN